MSTPQNAKWTLERVLARQDWSPALCSVTVSRGADFNFSAGQYTRLGLTQTDGSVVWRPFSMVSAPDAPHLEFFARLVPDGAFSCYLQSLAVGDEILVERLCYGFLTLEQFATGHDLWLISSGTGLGPFISILRAAHLWDVFKRVIVVHSVSYAHELAYCDELLALCAQEPRLTYLPVVTREALPEALSTRIPLLLTSGALEEASAQPLTLEGSRIMVCGNPELTAEVRRVLTLRGFQPNRRATPGQLAFEKYW